MTKWPPELARLEAFVLGAGLLLTKEGQPDPACFGNFWQEYSDEVLVLAMGYDREWFVTVGPRGCHPQDDYDPAILRDFFGDSSSEESSLQADVNYLMRAWPDITRSFSPAQREASRRRLDDLRKDRTRRLFPGLSP
jgi:hypothetical protein